MNDIITLLQSPDFAELRHQRKPIKGEREGPANQPKVLGWTEEYQLAWRVEPGYVRWVYAPTLAELPALVAAKKWE